VNRSRKGWTDGGPNGGAGEIALSTTIPSGLAGLVVDLGGVGIVPSGKVRFSNEVTLTFN